MSGKLQKINQFVYTGILKNIKKIPKESVTLIRQLADSTTAN